MSERGIKMENKVKDWGRVGVLEKYRMQILIFIVAVEGIIILINLVNKKSPEYCYMFGGILLLNFMICSKVEQKNMEQSKIIVAGFTILNVVFLLVQMVFESYHNYYMEENIIIYIFFVIIIISLIAAFKLFKFKGGYLMLTGMIAFFALMAGLYGFLYKTNEKIATIEKVTEINYDWSIVKLKDDDSIYFLNREGENSSILVNVFNDSILKIKYKKMLQGKDTSQIMAIENTRNIEDGVIESIEFSEKGNMLEIKLLDDKRKFEIKSKKITQDFEDLVGEYVILEVEKNDRFRVENIIFQ